MAMMRGSRRFQLHFVARKCAAYLDQFVASSPNIFSPENVLNIYKAADEYVFPRLRDESRKFAALRFWDLIGTQCFKDLSFTVSCVYTTVGVCLCYEAFLIKRIRCASYNPSN